jgi:hypothetical protein
MQQRIINKVYLDEEVYHTGDLLVARRFAGWSTLFMLLTGGMATHVAMVVDEGEGDKYVYECMSEEWWSEAGATVQRTPLKEWLSKAEEAEFEVSWLRLSREYELNFDLPNLINWFMRVEGSHYSMVREFFAAVDSPDESFPPPFNTESVPINLRLFHELHLGSKKL